MLQVQELDLIELKPWDDNPRLNDQAVDAVVRSIRAFGFNVPILCDQNLNIIAGHTRCKAAKELGLKVVPVIVLEMTDVQRRAFSLADNKTAQIAEWDFPKLCKVLEKLNSEDIDLTVLGFSEPELEALLTNETGPNWDEFDRRLAVLEDKALALLPVKVSPQVKEPIQMALRSQAAKIGIDEKDMAVLAGKVIQRLLGVNL